MIIFLILAIFYCLIVLVNAELLVNYLQVIGWLNLALYIISTILFLKRYRSRTLLSPEFLFSIIFLFCTYLFLPLVYSSNIDSFIFDLLLQESNLNLLRAQSIATMSYFFYLFGAVLFKRKSFQTNRVSSFNFYLIRVIKRRSLIHKITFIFICVSMITGGWQIIYRYTGIEQNLNEVGIMYRYITILLVMSSFFEFYYLKSIQVDSIKQTFKKINKLFFFNILFMILLFLIAGYRSAAFPLIIPIIFLYELYIKKIYKIVLLSVLLIGFVFMTAIKETRADKDVETSSFTNLWYIGGDFSAANKAMYYFVDYTDSKGSQQGKNTVLPMISGIPFAQSFVINMFDFKPSESSSMVFTNDMESYWSGLGTHVIGDLYYSFGIIGTLLFMFILGSFTSYLYMSSLADNSMNIWQVILYLLILGNSIMFSRVEFFSLVQSIGFSIIVLWILSKLAKYKAF